MSFYSLYQTVTSVTSVEWKTLDYHILVEQCGGVSSDRSLRMPVGRTDVSNVLGLKW